MAPASPPAGVFAQTFRRLHARGLRPAVLHPAAAIPSERDLRDAEAKWRAELPPEVAAFMGAAPTFLSINRFERKKVRRGAGPRASVSLCCGLPL